MKKSITLILSTLILVSCGKVYQGDIIINKISLIDVESGDILPNKTVVIANNKIDTIVDFDADAKLQSEKIIDGSGKYLIPGLWDMHTHVLWSIPEYHLHNAIMISNGITGIRDMQGSDSIARLAKKDFQSKTMPLQRIYRTNLILDGYPKVHEENTSVKNPEEALKLVDSLYSKSDAEFIKVYGNLDKPTFQAIAERCKELGIEFMGHVPLKLSVEEAAQAGMRSMEHMLQMQLAFSTEKDSLYKILDSIRYDPLFVLNTQSNDALDTIASILRQNNCAVVPTIITYQGQGRKLNRQPIDPEDPRNDFVPAFCKEYWLNDMPAGPLPPFVAKLIEDSHARNIELAGLLHDKGVTILAGSDVACSNAFTYSGFSLHDELQNFVKAGISTKDIVKIATIDAAKFVKMNDSLGLVKSGFLADLVVLSDNPFEDIGNLQHIEAVISNGDLYDRQALDALQKLALDQAQSITGR